MAETIPIHKDSQTCRLYANDASMYEELPEGVAFPKTIGDIRNLVIKANEEQFSITARGAGTSLAGQATGGGIIMDVSRHMNKILSLDAEQHYAHVQPGVIRDTLNRKAQEHNLMFGPDTATTNRCMIGGMIGNNSCGSFSIKYGTTREHVLEVEAVLSDGSTATFKPLSDEELEQKKQLDSLEGHIYRGIVKLIERNREQILEAYPHPEIIRRNTGYALDKLCTMRPFDTSDDARPFNLAELLCGSEGTLAMTASAKVRLVPVEKHAITLVPHFDSIRSAMEATVEAVQFDPAAAELVDHIILDATKKNIEQRKNRFILEGEPRCILIIQFEGDRPERLRSTAEELKEQLQKKRLGYSAPIISNPDEIERVWNLRKAGLGLLMGLGSDSRSPSFCEDTAVRVRDLPDYVDDFQALLNKYKTDCVFYAHASVGELHLRPVIDIQKPEGIQKMKAMAEEIADLVKQYGGSLSGEHGDGRARSPYIEKVLGKEMMPLLQQVKELWDPHYMFNPGKIVRAKPIEENLRYSPSYQKPSVDTAFHWRKEGDFGSALELCNGAGVCRKTAESEGTMCPSYHATTEEKDSTRGRANLFRQLFSSRNKDAFNSEELRDALDLCISCKACKSECPANVDMARMKAEFMQGWHEENGISLSERFFGEPETFYPIAGLFPRLGNWFINTAVGKELLYRFANVHRERTLPQFAPETFIEWYKKESTLDNTSSAGRAVLLVDLFTNYHDPGIAKSALNVLNHMGYEVICPGVFNLGRTQLSKGMVKRAKERVRKNIARLYPYAEQELPIIGLEPSEILTLRDEYLDLCDDEDLEKAKKIADFAFQFEEFISGPDFRGATNGARKVYVHGHCHAKSLAGMESTLQSLRKAGYDPVDLQTGCCGMAGSFGYEADHYKISMEIGELILFPSLRELDPEALICAPGFSCRHQIKDGTGHAAYHPAELIARNL